MSSSIRACVLACVAVYGCGVPDPPSLTEYGRRRHSRFYIADDGRAEHERRRHGEHGKLDGHDELDVGDHVDNGCVVERRA